MPIPNIEITKHWSDTSGVVGYAAFGSALGIMEKQMTPNQASAGNGAVASRFHAAPIESNKRVLLRAHREVWSHGRLDSVGEIYSKDYVCHFSSGYEWKGVEGFKTNLIEWRVKFPDWCETVNEIIAEEDFVVTRWTSTGTHSGVGAPDLAGKKVCISEIAVHRLKDGKIVEQWGLWDFESLKKQLGERPDF